MATLEVLNSEAHKHLRLRRSAGPVPHFVPIVALEFAIAATCCPILLCKDPETGRFYAGAMFGFKPGENLVEEVAGSADPFRPLDIERQAFFVSGENIAIDIEHARISDSEGEPLFDETGEPSEALQRIQRALGLLVSGTEYTNALIQTFVELRLVEPIDISLRFDDGQKLELDGLYTVSLDAIADLEDTAVLSLFRKGYLQAAYAIAGSLRQIAVLASRRNQQLVGGSQL
jgi:hypothetical protein